MRNGFNANVHLTNGKTIFLHNLEYLTTSDITVSVEFADADEERNFVEKYGAMEGATLKRRANLFVLFLPTDVRVSYCAMWYSHK